MKTIIINCSVVSELSAEKTLSYLHAYADDSVNADGYLLFCKSASCMNTCESALIDGLEFDLMGGGWRNAIAAVVIAWRETIEWPDNAIHDGEPTGQSPSDRTNMPVSTWDRLTFIDS